MLPFTCNDTIGCNKRSGYLAFFHRLDQECFIVSAIPIQCCPAVKEIVSRFPAIFFAYPIYVVTVTFAGAKIPKLSRSRVPRSNVCDIFASVFNFVKGWCVNIQMNWLLVVKQYIIVFVYVIPAVVTNCVWVTSTKWFIKKHSHTRPVLVEPRPKSIVVNFVYSNHV